MNYEVEENNYSCKKLQKRYDKMKESKSYKKLMNKVFEEMKVKHPERIKRELRNETYSHE